MSFDFSVKRAFKEVFLSALFTVVSALLLMALFGAGKLIFGFDDGVVKAVTQTVKFLSVFACCFICVNTDGGFIKGFTAGILSAVLTTALFCAIAGNRFFTAGLLLDVAVYAVVGGIAGTFAVILKRG